MATIMSVSITRDKKKGWGMKYALPMDGATAQESEHCAAQLLKAANAQLHYAKSQYRLAGLYNISTLIYICFAPRLYVIEQLSNLAK